MTETPYGFRIVGPCSGERRLVDWRAAFAGYAACDARARCDSEGYLSAFTFGQPFADHLNATGTTRGYSGPCGAAFLWWDIDRADDLERARIDSAGLAAALCNRFGLADDDLLAFYSGSKGFHLGLPVSLPPSGDFHRVARRFCEAVAEGAGVVIDCGVYDAVRAFRAPNSRHPKTGRYKRRVTLDELMHLNAEAIAKLAQTPEPFDGPTALSDRCDAAIAADWNAAAEHVRLVNQAKSQRQAAIASGTVAPTLNRLTLDFIRNGAGTGDRHRILYSAARNLAEHGCPLALVTALLTESALDSGLPPGEVRRQIDCGLNDAGSQGSEGAA
jgi:hypothetical protein